MEGRLQRHAGTLVLCLPGQGQQSLAELAPGGLALLRGQGAGMEVKCDECERTIDDTKLYKCPICFKHVCEEHTHRMSGREFCSYGCARFFFFDPPPPQEMRRTRDTQAIHRPMKDPPRDFSPP